MHGGRGRWVRGFRSQVAAALNEMSKAGKTFPSDEVDALVATIEESKRSLQDALKLQESPIKQALLDCGAAEEDKETRVVQLSTAAREFFASASGQVKSQLDFRYNSAVAKLRKTLASTNSLLSNIPVADEKEFRKKMLGSVGGKLATKQKDLMHALAESKLSEQEKN